MTDTVVVSAMGRGRSAGAIETILATFDSGLGGREPALVMVFPSTKQVLSELCSALVARYPKAAVLGASTAGEFTEIGDESGAVAAVAIAGDFQVAAGMGSGVKASAEAAVSEAVGGLPLQLAGYPHRTALMLIDPLSGHCEEAALIAGAILGEGVRMAGGAAGDDLAMAKTQVALGERAASDSLVLAMIFSKSALGVGVSHGHRAISKQLRITRANGATVEEIDGRPAWDVWLENTREIAAKSGIDVDNLEGSAVGGYLLRYEASLDVGQEIKVRAPLKRLDNGAIGFACEIPEGAMIRITESEPKSQLTSAREAARLARAQLASPAAGAVVFDCICRKLILGDAFAEATRSMSDELGGVPIAGFETYGEIALDVGDMSGFHNTTSVVLAFPSK